MNQESGAVPRTPAVQALPRLAYKIAEAAVVLGVSQITIRRAITRGLLTPCRAFRTPLIPAEQLTQLLKGLPDNDPPTP